MASSLVALLCLAPEVIAGEVYSASLGSWAISGLFEMN